jgi:hypothetical protein
LLILNRKEHGYIRERLAAHAIPEDRVEIRSVAPALVAGEIRDRIDAGIFFIKPLFSKNRKRADQIGGVSCLWHSLFD